MARLQITAGSIERFLRWRSGTDTTGRRRPGRACTVETLEDRVVPATITVTSLGDSGVGTLRAAIEQANLDAAQDTIDFAPSVTGTISLSSALPDLSTNVILDGPGATVLTVARSSNAGSTAFSIFTVPDGVEATISGLTITGGKGNAVQFNTLTRVEGGGIDNTGTLTVTNCMITGNSASDFGGGISNLGTLTVTNSTITGNMASAGGGIDNGGTLTVTNSTITGNAGDFGGAIENGIITSWTPAKAIYRLYVTNCTISDNSAGMVGGITSISNYLGTVTNSLISGNLGGSYSGPPTIALSHNLITDAPDPFLGPLADNGGPTDTMALLPGSPAIDAGVPVAGVTTDQRGVARPQGTAPDIGAFESRGFTIAIVSGDDQSATCGSTFPEPLTVRVTSPFGEPVAGGRVTFAAPATGASAGLSTDPAIIDANGQAVVTVTANGIGGAYAVTARTAGAMDVAFALTNSGPPAVTGVVAVTHSTRGITRIMLGFSEDMIPRSATNRRFFSIAAGVQEKRRGLVFSKRVKISGLSYDGAAHQVTIRMAKPVTGIVQVTVQGGIRATNGLSSHGRFTAVVN
jgi:hypothetical protein